MSQMVILDRIKIGKRLDRTGYKKDKLFTYVPDSYKKGNLNIWAQHIYKENSKRYGIA